MRKRIKPYDDWYQAYVEEVRDKLLHFGERPSKSDADSAVKVNRTDLDGSLFGLELE